MLGYAEDPAYATSSTIVAELIGEKEDATTVICGGDTTAFVEAISTKHPNLHYSLISTGGGASLNVPHFNRVGPRLIFIPRHNHHKHVLFAAGTF